MTPVILFVFGAVTGSFLNVVALRYNSGLSLGGRSACAHCGRKLRWFELVPVLSYLYLRGRCRGCRAKISRQYPLVELWTGLLFATLPLSYLPVFSLYVAITVYDLRHKIIPDGLAYAAAALALLFALLMGGRGLLDWLAGPVLFSFFGLIWFLSRGRAMGFGDAKLALSIGLLLGAREGFSAVVAAFWIGAAYGIGAMIFSPKRLTMKSEVPFAPFLVLGSWAAAALHLDLLHVSSFFQ
ncbi:prepilin peptidase [Candidatus Parcubacteria bacterium]|nr:prepilin peptidase [Candidatus Parcubacteria bacterium]